MGKLSWRKVDNIILTYVLFFFILAAQSLFPHAIPGNSLIITMLKNSKIVVFCPFDTGTPIRDKNALYGLIELLCQPFFIGSDNRIYVILPLIKIIQRRQKERNETLQYI